MRFSSILLVLACLASPGTANAQIGGKSAPIAAIAISPDGSEVFTGSQAGVNVLSWPELKEKSKLASGLEQVNDLAFSPDGKQLLIAGGSPGEIGGIEIWSWPEGKLLIKAVPHGDLIYKGCWSARGDRIVTASADGVSKSLDSETLETKATYQGHSRSILAAAWVYGDGLVATAGVDQTIQLWEAKSGVQKRTLSNHVGSVNEIVFRPGLNEGPPILASISEDKTLRLWQPVVGRLMRFTKLPSPPRVLAWLPAGEHLIVGCNDGQLRIVDFDELKTVKELPVDVGRVHAISLHPKDSMILVGGEKGVRAIDLPALDSK